MQANISTKDAMKFIWSVVKSFPLAIMVMLTTSFIWAIDLAIRPYILKIILDRVSKGESHDFWYLGEPALLWCLCAFVMITMYRVYGYFVEIKMIPFMRIKIDNIAIERLTTQSYNYYQNNFAGSLANKVKDLISSIPEILQIIIDKFLSTLLALSFAIYVLWQVNSIFGIIMLTWVIIFLSVTIFMSRHLIKLSDNWSEHGSIITGKMVDALSNILLVRLFARVSYERKILDDAFFSAAKAEQKLWWMYFWIWFFNGYSFLATMIFNFYYLISGYNAGIITVGDFALVLAMSIAVIDSLWELSFNLTRLSKEFGKVTQALRAVLVVSEITDIKGAKNLEVSNGKIEFENVQFHYKGVSPLFQNKSIIIPAGQKIGLVGYSGSGKSTFVNLILRMFDVVDGRILIDGQDISKSSQDSLRKAIGMIPQDPSLFHRSLMDNIRYGKIEASDSEVIEASKRAHAHEFISNLEHGYESLVGERGIKLSGGQRQRIAIARAVLKNAPILILDEATSQMDSLTESDIQDSLWKLMQGKTTLVIAHRLSTLLNMDRILVFNKGKIVEDGTHEELLKKSGLYRTLWDTQVGGFLPDEEKKE